MNKVAGPIANKMFDCGMIPMAAPSVTRWPLVIGGGVRPSGCGRADARRAWAAASAPAAQRPRRRRRFGTGQALHRAARRRPAAGRAPGWGSEDPVVHGGGGLHEYLSCLRAADRLFGALRRDAAAAQPAQDRRSGRRPCDGVHLRRQGDGRLRAGGENLVAVAAAPPTIEWRAQAGVRTRGDLLPVHRPAAPRSVRRISPGAIQAFVVGPSTVVGGVKTDT